MLDYARRCSQKPYFKALESRESFIIEVDLPGLSDKKAVDIEFTNTQTLLVQGEITRNVPKDDGPGFQAVKSNFEQTFKLLHFVDQGNTRAKLADGILRIVLPKVGKKKVEVE